MSRASIHEDEIAFVKNIILHHKYEPSNQFHRFYMRSITLNARMLESMMYELCLYSM